MSLLPQKNVFDLYTIGCMENLIQLVLNTMVVLTMILWPVIAPSLDLRLNSYIVCFGVVATMLAVYISPVFGFITACLFAVICITETRAQQTREAFVMRSEQLCDEKRRIKNEGKAVDFLRDAVMKTIALSHVRERQEKRNTEGKAVTRRWPFDNHSPSDVMLSQIQSNDAPPSASNSEIRSDEFKLACEKAGVLAYIGCDGKEHIIHKTHAS
jgi:hypothetical protein